MAEESARLPTDRYIDGVDQSSFLLAPDGLSNRNRILLRCWGALAYLYRRHCLRQFLRCDRYRRSGGALLHCLPRHDGGIGGFRERFALFLRLVT